MAEHILICKERTPDMFKKCSKLFEGMLITVYDRNHNIGRT